MGANHTLPCSQSARLMPAAKCWEGAVNYWVGLQAVFDFMERDRTPEVVKMHVVETLQLIPEQVKISASESLSPIDQKFICQCVYIILWASAASQMHGACRGLNAVTGSG